MSKQLKNIDQLDSLRAFAAFSVIIFHYLPEYNLGNFAFGWMGVDLFFVISGYLITAILIEQKEKIGNKLLIIKNFIIKRALRLFPIYYLFISTFLFLKYSFGLNVWDLGNEIYYYTYTQNILFFKEGMKGIQANHLWTLAVEEQFYLFWPWLLIYISNKKLIFSLLIIIPLTLFFKTFSGIENLRMLTFLHFDTLGSGALIALLLKEKGEQFFIPLNNLKTIIIFISIVMLSASRLMQTPNFLIKPSLLILSVSLVIGCYYKFKGFWGYFLNISQVKYLGKISFGLYLYHKPIPYFMKFLASKTTLQLNSSILFILSIVLIVIIAHLSYQVIEIRFMKLKDSFDL
jgi:peptidoglycan/LPS O-acetylase OafA/YrhL